MIQRFDVGSRLSEMAVHNGIAWLAGQVPDDATQDIRGQTRQVLAAVDALLARARSDKSRILMAQIYLADLSDFAGDVERRVRHVVYLTASCDPRERRAS